jgi:hypothetical protein
MPEPVHWLVSEPERGQLSAAVSGTLFDKSTQYA